MRTALPMSFAASAAIQGLNVMTGVLLARQLGPHDRGELAAILLWPAVLASLGSLGVTEATTFFIARRLHREEVVTGTSYVIALLLSGALCVGGIGVVTGVLSRYDDQAVSLGLVFLAYIPLNLLTLFSMAVLNGQQRFRAFNSLRVGVIATIAIGLCAAALAGKLGVAMATVIYLGTNALTMAVAVALVFARLEGRLAFSWTVTRRLLGFGLKSHTTNLSSALNQRLDQLLISIFLAPAQLGLYVVATTLGSLALLVGTSVAMVALPSVAAIPAGSERSDLATRYVRITLAVATAGTIPIILLTPQLLDVFFGHEFRSAATVCRILLVASIALGLNRTLGASLTAGGKPLQAGVGETIGLVVTVVALGAMLPILGLIGAAIASLLAYGAAALYMAFRACRVFERSPLQLFLPSVVTDRFTLRPERSAL